MATNYTQQLKIAGRLNKTDAFNDLIQITTSITDTLQGLPSPKSMHVRDKNSVNKKLNAKLDSYAKAWQRAAAAQTAKLDKLEADIKTNALTKSTDLALIPLMAGKTNVKLLEMARTSEPVARLLAGDAGTVLGIDEQARTDILLRLSPALAEQRAATLKIMESLEGLAEPKELRIEADRYALSVDEQNLLDTLEI